jgi:hypothetical protein
LDIRLVQLLASMGRINPAIWDWIVPMGPERAFSASSLASEVELNPQPIPPGHELQFAAVRVANEIALAAIAAEAAGEGEDAHRIVTQAIDDWCGTPTGHRPFPWPGPWPIPWHLQDPDPHPWSVETSRVVGALTLASVASRMTEGSAQEALAHGAERLMEVALQTELAFAH